eukprot:1591529-Prymnesium_polylepis.1
MGLQAEAWLHEVRRIFEQMAWWSELARITNTCQTHRVLKTHVCVPHVLTICETERATARVKPYGTVWSARRTKTPRPKARQGWPERGRGPAGAKLEEHSWFLHLLGAGPTVNPNPYM